MLAGAEARSVQLYKAPRRGKLGTWTHHAPSDLYRRNGLQQTPWAGPEQASADASQVSAYARSNSQLARRDHPIQPHQCRTICTVVKPQGAERPKRKSAYRYRNRCVTATGDPASGPHRRLAATMSGDCGGNAWASASAMATDESAGPACSSRRCSPGKMLLIFKHVTVQTRTIPLEVGTYCSAPTPAARISPGTHPWLQEVEVERCTERWLWDFVNLKGGAACSASRSQSIIVLTDRSGPGLELELGRVDHYVAQNGPLRRFILRGDRVSALPRTAAHARRTRADRVPRSPSSPLSSRSRSPHPDFTPRTSPGGRYCMAKATASEPRRTTDRYRCSLQLQTPQLVPAVQLWLV
ncbi:hypothetical protein C8Q80DRAFT_739310 [Daedaleopsis nitida]|nr:hypothetical protein C8Q80DRAFT_739310 [Daedaleopsis nitida]